MISLDEITTLIARVAQGHDESDNALALLQRIVAPGAVLELPKGMGFLPSTERMEVRPSLTNAELSTAILAASVIATSRTNVEVVAIGVATFRVLMAEQTKRAQREVG